MINGQLEKQVEKPPTSSAQEREDSVPRLSLYKLLQEKLDQAPEPRGAATAESKKAFLL